MTNGRESSILGAIRLLSEGLINRIAAGEVVERPASVLKELIENSLDAGADRLEIEVQAGGRRLISVADNGSGMIPDDMLLAIERHATSKLAEETDLMAIPTLGFRGEALASIASVSRVTLASSAGDDGAGRQVTVSGGRVMQVRDAARDRGTTVEVRDLFYNVPARRKFLKSVATEAAHLLETVQRYALSDPDLRLIYRHNGQELLATSPRENNAGRLARVVGRETARRMIPFEGREGSTAVSGFLGPPDLDKSRTTSLYLFVNRRPVRDRLLTRAVVDAYRSRLAAGRYPAAVIFLELAPELVDVNVHPAKTEVRFREPNEVFRAVVAVIAQALSESLRPETRPSPPPYPPLPSSSGEVREARFWENPSLPEEPWIRVPTVSPDPENVSVAQYNDPGAEPVRHDETVRPFPETDPTVSPGNGSPWRPIGQLFRSYILAQGIHGLIIIDQHAAHERILYEYLRRQMDSGVIAGQTLLLPETIDVSPLEADRLEKLAPHLERFGFDLAFFGGNTFVLKAAPAMLGRTGITAAVRDIIDSAEDFQPEAGLDQLAKRLIESLACHGAVKANEAMTLAEMDRLLADLACCETPTHCPHGRPLLFEMDRRELEKKFKRA
jgi:DNA mismatch repair protein MutL